MFVIQMVTVYNFWFSGEKPYSCQICNKSFSDCSNLTKHRRTHIKLQPEQHLDIQDEHLNEEVHLNSEDFGQGQAVWNIIEESSIQTGCIQTSNRNQVCSWLVKVGGTQPYAVAIQIQYTWIPEIFEYWTFSVLYLNGCPVDTVLQFMAYLCIF